MLSPASAQCRSAKHAGWHDGRAHVEGAVVGRVDALEAAQQLREGRQPGVQLRELRLPPLAVAPSLGRVADAAVRKLLLDLRSARVTTLLCTDADGWHQASVHACAHPQVLPVPHVNVERHVCDVLMLITQAVCVVTSDARQVCTVALTAE